VALGRVVLLDALGTLVALEPPAPRLARALGVDEAAARRAMRAEIAHYRAEHHRAGDAAGLAAVRRECAEVVRDVLGDRRPVEEVEAALLASVVFRAFPEVPGALRAWRAAGARLVVCSNWDVSLREVLDATGLAALVDGVVTSAEEGVAKPDPALFAAALGGADPALALHVGDEVATDVYGARAAGVAPLLLVREGAPPPGVPAVRDLAEAVEHWRR
jgi:putative hydrolase of the HAD superfamily